MGYTLQQLAEHAGAKVVGDADHHIDGVGTLATAAASQISFLTNQRYRNQLRETRAGAVILTPADLESCPVNALVTDDPHLCYARISALYANETVDKQKGIDPSSSIHASAYIDDSALIGPACVIGPGAHLAEGCVLGPGCSVGAGVSIGRDSRLVAGVHIYHDCSIGQRALIHAGVVIGSDGFGFAPSPEGWVKVHQLGAVQIGDDVEIGANTTIDRGAIEDTVIGNGVKLDNLIQVAHNVQIGDNTVIAANVGIAGSAVIGKNCQIAGGVGILGHLEIVDGVVVTAMSLVTNSIKKPGVYSAGTPLEPKRDWQKNFIRFKQLDDMARRIKALEQQLQNYQKEG